MNFFTSKINTIKRKNKYPMNLFHARILTGCSVFTPDAGCETSGGPPPVL